MSIGKRIRSERERLGISQEELRIACGISYRTQMAYELGESEPKVSYIVKFSELGADMNYIVTGNRAETIVERVFEGAKPEFLDGFNLLMPAQRNEIEEQIKAMRAGNMETYEFMKNRVE